MANPFAKKTPAKSPAPAKEATPSSLAALLQPSVGTKRKTPAFSSASPAAKRPKTQ